MATRFRVRIGDEECVCEAAEAAPSVAAMLRHALPVRTFATHAKFAGHELILMLPFWTEAENFIRPEGNVEGDVCFYPGRQTLCIFYGHVTPFGKPGNVLARLVEGEDAMRRAARAVLERGTLPATVFLEGEEEGQGALPLSPPETALTPRVRTFLDSVWGQEPDDVRALRTFTRPLMGNTPCVLYACFDLFWAGETLQTCRELLREGRLSLPDLNRTTAALLERTRRRLAHWEMPATVSLLADCVDYFGSKGPAIADEYDSITRDLLVALGRVQSWIDALIPWAKLDGALAAEALAAVRAGTLVEEPRPIEGGS